MSYSLYCIKGPFVGQEIPLTDVLIIGRDPSSVNLVIQDAGVSRAHVKLYETQEGLVLEDLNSANGTFICLDSGETQTVKGAIVLNPGNRFSVGNNSQYIFELRSGNNQQTELSTPVEPQTVRGTNDIPLIRQAPAANAPVAAPNFTPIPDQRPQQALSATADDIFQTTTKVEITEDLLATRTSRFIANLIDSFILSITLMVAMGLGASTSSISGFITTVALAYLSFLFINGYFLSTRAQTVGKKLMQIYIADLNGRKAGFPTIIGMRMVVMSLLILIPFIGWIIGIANIFFIFRQDRRMIHDMLAGTVVLKCRNPQTNAPYSV